jgi:hypothetical protein
MFEHIASAALAAQRETRFARPRTGALPRRGTNLVAATGVAAQVLIGNIGRIP